MAGTLTLYGVMMMLTLMLIDFNVDQMHKPVKRVRGKLLGVDFFWIFNAKVQPDLKDTKQGLASGNGTFLADQ